MLTIAILMTIFAGIPLCISAFTTFATLFWGKGSEFMLSTILLAGSVFLVTGTWILYSNIH